MKYTSNREGKLFSIDCDMRRGTRNPIVKELSLRGSGNKQNTLFLFVEVWEGLKSARIYTERRNTQETLHRNRSRIVERRVLLARKVELLHLRHIFVLFRATKWFRRRSSGTVTRAKFGFQESSDMSEETRRLRLEAFLAKNHFITRREYSGLTGLLKGKAQRELNLLVENGVLNTRGYGNRIIYLKSENQPIK